MNDAQEGTILDDKFSLLRRLGSGAQGQVFAAIQLGLDRKVAIKILDVELAKETEPARFEREARILCSLQHPNICQFYAFGKTSEGSYFAMEYAEGISLNKIRPADLSLEQIIEIGIQCCKGLEYIHSQEVIHRDIKPSNIMINSASKSASARIVDFGLSRWQGHSELQKLTAAKTMVGTVTYASPEQCIGHQADARSDIYSLGCVLYELVTGRPPFEGAESHEVMLAHLHQQPNAVSQAGHRKIPAMLDECITQALEKEPGKRQSSMSEMRQQLETAIAQIPAPNDERRPIAASKLSNPKTKSLSRIAIIAVALGAIVLGVGTWYCYNAQVSKTFDSGIPNNLEFDQLIKKSQTLVAENDDAGAEAALLEAIRCSNQCDIEKQGTILARYAKFLADRDRLADSEVYLAKALEKMNSETCSNQAKRFILMLAAYIRLRQNRYQESASLSSQGMDLKRNEFGEVPPELVQLLLLNGEANYRLGLRSRAIESTQKAEVVALSERRTNKPLLSQIRARLKELRASSH